MEHEETPIDLRSLSFRDSSGETTFADVLPEYKRQGCAFLVTGAVSATVGANALRKLAGGPDADRKRVVVLGDGRTDPERLLPDGVTVDDPDVRVVRSHTDPKTLRERIVDAVVYFDDATDGLEPGQLRLLYESFDEHYAAYDPSTARRLVRGTNAVVRGVHGMAFVRFCDDDTDPVDSLTSLFEGRVELRDDAVPEMRWHLPSHGLTSSWIRL